MTVTRLVLVRHGQHDLAIDDGPLTNIGIRQSVVLARALHVDGTDAVSSSPWQRARQTVEHFGVHYTVNDHLRGIDFGESFAGESIGAFLDRVARAMARLTAASISGRVIVCTHSDVIDAALRWARGLDPHRGWTIQSVVCNASTTELEIRPGAPAVICRVGDVSYLPAELVTDI